MFLSSSRARVVCIKDIWFPATYTGCNGIGSGLGSNVERGFDDMGILCVFCVYDTIGNRCFEKTSFPKTNISRLSNINALGIFDFAIMEVMVKLDSSFVQTWKGPHLQCYIPRPMAFWLRSRRYLKVCFTIYGCGGHLGHVTRSICTNFKGDSNHNDNFVLSERTL